MAYTEFQFIPPKDRKAGTTGTHDLADQTLDPRARIFNPLTALMLDGGNYVIRCNPERFTQDPELAARIADLPLHTSSLMQVVEPGEIESMTHQWLDALKSCEALVITDFDYPILMAMAEGPNKVHDIRLVLRSALIRLLHTQPKFMLISTYTGLLDSLFMGDDRIINLNGTIEGDMLIGMDEGALGIFYGRRLQQLSVQKGLTPDLLMYELDMRCLHRHLYVKPMIESWVNNNALGPSRYMPFILTDGPLIDRLVEKGLVTLKQLDSPYPVTDKTDQETVALLELLDTCGVLAWDSERKVYESASQSADRILGLLTLMMVVRADSDWMTPAQDIVMGMMNMNPNGVAQAVEDLMLCVEDEDADLDLPGLVLSTLYCSDIEAERLWDDEHTLDVIRMRLPGGIHELIFAPADFDVNTLVDDIALEAEALEAEEALQMSHDVQLRRKTVRTASHNEAGAEATGARYKYPTPRIILNVLG